MVSSVCVVSRTALAEDLGPERWVLSPLLSRRRVENMRDPRLARGVSAARARRGDGPPRPSFQNRLSAQSSGSAATVRLLLFWGIRMRGPLCVGGWCQLIGWFCTRTDARRAHRATRGCPLRAGHASSVKTGQDKEVLRSRSRGGTGRLFVQACTEGGMHALSRGLLPPPSTLPVGLRVHHPPVPRLASGGHPPCEVQDAPPSLRQWRQPASAREGLPVRALQPPVRGSEQGSHTVPLTRSGRLASHSMRRARACDFRRGHPTPAVGARPHAIFGEPLL